VGPNGFLREFWREIGRVVMGRTPTHFHLRQRLLGVLIVTLVVDAIGTVVVYYFERHAPGTEITNIGDSLFWTSAQLLTVSSQMKNPISTGGRVVDLIHELYAISVVATLAGSFGAFFHRRGLERHPIHIEQTDLINRPLPEQPSGRS
jgi:hypothetical protein